MRLPCHLWAFARDVGLDYQTEGRVYINDLWERLQAWYINNGTLEIVTTDGGKEKKVWHDQPRRGDKNVKAPNQIHQRFAELFPKIKRKKEESYERRGQAYLSGIAINKDSSQYRGNIEANIEPIIEPVSTAQQAFEPIEAISFSSGRILKWLAELKTSERQAIISEINQAFSERPGVEQIGSIASNLDTEGATASITGSITGSITDSPASLTTRLEIGSHVASSDRQEVSYNWHGTIVRFRNGGADVRWDERQGMKGGEVLWHRLEDLRLL